jgi:hypothetical protein
MLPVLVFDKALLIDGTEGLTKLRYDFTLEPVEFCINYWLFIDSAPSPTHIYINGKPVESYKDASLQPFALDVTLYVALGENQLEFQIPSGVAGHFSGVRLQGVPCE